MALLANTTEYIKLDHIFYVEGLKWIGSSNELNAAYAADGYARAKSTAGCLVTTHGVGELSALNGVAGSASEHVPVVHVVGQTPMVAQENHLMIHHSIGFQPDHQIYNKISKHIRYSAAELAHASDPAAEIDRVLRDCVVHKQPVYIFLPIDKTDSPVPSARLHEHIDTTPAVNEMAETAAVADILDALYKAKKPAVYVDYFANRCTTTETQELLDKLDLPFYGAHMGKGAFNEDNENYVGMYNGAVTAPGIAEQLESSDFVLSIGWFEIDTNSTYFSRRLPEDIRVDIMPENVNFRGRHYASVYMAPLLRRLASCIETSRIAKYSKPKAEALSSADNDESSAITHALLWPRMGEFLRPGDYVLADTGTATYGLPDIRFPANVKYTAQSYWMSIGFTCPAAVGVDIALSEMHQNGKSRGRTVLMIGDGALMLTIQEVGIMFQRKLPILM
ncbi:MAG: hypothetical protein Q9162_007562 [Coniocarpon cinnabarinum]